MIAASGFYQTVQYSEHNTIIMMINEEFIYWLGSPNSICQTANTSICDMLVCILFNWLFLSTSNEYVTFNGFYSGQILYICTTKKWKEKLVVHAHIKTLFFRKFLILNFQITVARRTMFSLDKQSISNPQS